MKETEIKAYAKINLSLDVLAKRGDGYHDVDMVMQLIGLHDLLAFTWEDKGKASYGILDARGTGDAENGITVACGKGDGKHALRPAAGVELNLSIDDDTLPANESNLIFKAAKAFCDYLAASGRPVPEGYLTISVEKRIPMAAGLAGGSADAAAVLLAMDQLWETHLGLDALCEISETFGSDIAFAVRGMAKDFPEYEDDAFRCARATGRGTDLAALPAMEGPLVLVMPPAAVSTGKAYAALDEEAAKGHIKKRPDTEGVIRALAEKDSMKLCEAMANVFEAYTLYAHEEVLREKGAMEAALKKSGAEGIVQMSGTGPSLYVLTEDEEAAKAIARELKEQGLAVFETCRLG